MGLVHLHTHSHSSAFDGLGKEIDFCKRAKELGQEAIAFTEHGTLRGLWGAAAAAREVGIKLIPGVEAYLADDAARHGLTKEEKEDFARRYPDKDARRAAEKIEEKRRRDRDHITIWALNEEGLRNLYRLSAWAWGPGYYYKPRIDLPRLKEFGAGLAVSSGCPGGVIPSPLRAREFGEAIKRAEFLAETFGDRFYVEIMPHTADGDTAVAQQLLRLADRFGARVIATQDAHYPVPGDAEAQECLLCIHTNDKMSNPDRFCFPTRDFWLRSRGEMIAAFQATHPMIARRVVERALDETMAFADRVEAKVDPAKPGAFLVAPPLPAGTASYDAWLIDLVRIGVRDRMGVELASLGESYRTRLIYELRTISRLGFAAYFAMVWDVRRWAREAGIMQGPGRGSAAGSLVSYLLRITDLDPIEHGLSFDRFLAPGRKDLPDVDLDFDAGRREEVIDYLVDRYGGDRVAQISTANALRGKRALRDLARVHEIPEREIAPLASTIVESIAEEERHDDSLAKAFRSSELGRQFVARFPDVARIAERLEGQLRDVGIHAAGVVVSSVPLADVVPLESRSPKSGRKERTTVVAWDMKGAEGAGLVKIDLLGLRTLSVVAEALRICGKEVEALDVNDPIMLEGFTEGRFGGVFQFDSPSARRLCRGFQFKRFGDIAVITALNRPGPMQTGLAGQFIARAADPGLVESVHPVYDRVTADTYGVLVYQEQIVGLARELAGYTPEEADKLRKKVAKKLGVSDEHEKFVSGAQAAGMDREDAEKLFESIVGFGSYAFNRAHAFSYAAIAAWTMFLKVHHPEAFFTAYLAVEPDQGVQIRIAAEARRCGIPVRPPEINTSAGRFTLHRTAAGATEIVGSVADLKGIGQATADAIAKRRPFRSLLDFYERTAGQKIRVTARTFEILARAQAFRSFCPNTKLLVVNAAEIWATLKRGRDLVFNAADEVADYDQDEAAIVAGEVYPLFVDLAGRSAFDAVREGIESTCRRELVLPVDLPQEGPAAGLVFARLNAAKKFTNDDGSKQARLSLVTPDGYELVVRADQDVIDTSAAAVDATGECVLGLIRISETGRPTLERAWRAEEAASDEIADPVLGHLLRPRETVPEEPEWAIRRLREDGKTMIEGMIVRRRVHTDKKGLRMATIGLLGEAGYVRIYVFSGRFATRDARRLRLGAFVRLQVQKLARGAVCVGDEMIVDLDEARG